MEQSVSFNSEQFEQLLASVRAPVLMVDEQQASRVLGLSVKYLQKLRTTVRGPRFTKVGSRVCYRYSDLKRWAESLPSHGE